MTPSLQRFWFRLRTQQEWYAVMHECREWFGSNWRSQPRVRRRLADARMRHHAPVHEVWFDVPDERFATWVAVKLSLEVCSDSRRQAAK